MPSQYQSAIGVEVPDHTIAAVGLVSQLDRTTSVRLAHDMRVAAETVAAQLVS